MINKYFILFLTLFVLSNVVYSLDLIIEKGPPIPNLGNTNKQQKKDVDKAAEKLDYASLFVTKQKVIAEYGSIHIDMQGTFGDGPKYHNIQAQLTTGPTVAHVNLNENVMSNSKSDQKGITRKVIGALLKSLESGHTYTVSAKPKASKQPKKSKKPKKP